MNRSAEERQGSRVLSFLAECGRPRGVVKLTWLLLLAGLAWRLLRYALHFPLWGDEAFLAVNLLTRDFTGLIGSLEYNQIVPAGFMWLEWVAVKLLGESEYSLRMIPFLSSLASLILFWKWTSAILPRREVLLTVGILAGAYYLVRHGSELKPYSTDLFLAVLFSWLAWKTGEKPSGRGLYLLLFALAVLGPWISYPFILLAGGLIAFLGIQAIQKNSGASLGVPAFLAILLSVSFVALYVVHAAPQKQEAPWYFLKWAEAFPPVYEPWMIPWWLVKVHTGTMMAYPVGGNQGGSTVPFLLALLGLATLWKRGDRSLAGFLLFPLAFAFLAACFHRYPYGSTARTMLFMAPAFCLLTGVGLMRALKLFLPKRRVSLGVAAAALIVFVILAGGALRDLFRPYKELPDYHLRQAFQTMVRQSSPLDQWIVFPEYGPRTPDGLRGGGGGAVFRYYFMTAVPSVRGVWPAGSWPPEKNFPFPEEVRAEGETHLLAYRGDRGTFNEFQWISYLRSLEGRLGPGRRQVYFLNRSKRSEGRELAIETYTFPAKTKSSQ